MHMLPAKRISWFSVAKISSHPEYNSDAFMTAARVSGIIEISGRFGAGI
jgi:hypothetical protein